MVTVGNLVVIATLASATNTPYENEGQYGLDGQVTPVYDKLWKGLWSRMGLTEHTPQRMHTHI